MDLTQRHKSWLAAAWLATWREGAVFRRASVRDTLKLRIEESKEIAESLQKEGLVILLPTDEAILTDRGRHISSELGSPPQKTLTRASFRVENVRALAS